MSILFDFNAGRRDGPADRGRGGIDVAMTGSRLFGDAWATRFGLDPPDEPGDRRCAYCGSPCSGRHAAKDWIKSNFTEWQHLSVPTSPHVCGWCVTTLTEAADVPLCDGTTRPMTRSAVRQWSWIVTPSGPLGASKAHRDWLRRWLTDPPIDDGTPWLASISDGGQRHFLWRTRPNWSKDRYVIAFDGESIATTADRLRSTLGLQATLAMVVGRPALSDPGPSVVQADLLATAFPDRWESLVEEWVDRAGTPLWRLGAWLSPGREDAAECLASLGYDVPVFSSLETRQ